jgi:hypothetical protein
MNKFILTETLKITIKENIKDLFKNLNNNDITYLYNYLSQLIYHISNYYSFKQKEGERQWSKNKGQDIKSICLQLIPFVKNTNFTDLNYILYSKNKLDKNILDKEINDVLKNDMKYSNFLIGLLNENADIDLFPNNEKLIYKIIRINYYAFIETVKMTNGKLYVNWLNVFPVIDYKNTSIYKKNKIELQQLKNNINNLENIENYGLWFGDYYNIIRNGYYESIKKIKWVLYNTRIDNKQYYMIQYLTFIFNFKSLYLFNSYDDIDDIDKDLFVKKINKIISSIQNNIFIFKDINFEKDILKNLISFLVNNSPERFLLNKQYFIKFYLDIETVGEDLDKNETDIRNITDNDIISALKNIDVSILWNYLKETLILLKNSIYGHYLFIYNKKEKIYIINNQFFNFNIKNDNEYINLKNIYNIAKLLSHNNDFEVLGTNYNNLNIDRKKEFFYKYLNLNLNLRNNILYQERTLLNYNNIIQNIINGWNKINNYIIWQYLHYNGLLSEFKINFDLTDDLYLPISTSEKRLTIQRKLKTYFKNNKQIFNSNYFLTNDTYNNLNKYEQLINHNDTYDNFLIKYLQYYTFYGNDWISQLNIFNHYIYHQIMYVTGGTGTGKSTQIPKLLLYMLKMYDYKNNGKAICTQPRISPTEGNAKWISTEMGVSIETFNLEKKYKTNNYYLQYKDQKDQHTKENCPHLSLRFVTDGTLLEELVKNPFMKEQIKKKSKKYNNDYIYGFNNKYDLIIIDEAHEHNTNMDLILTLMRQTCFLNNSVRLIIISATMDDDEPIYRSYFKYINDDIVYPIKNKIYINDNEDLNSLMMDRRVDISKPGQTTQYTIEEYYRDDLIPTNNHKKDFVKAQEESYKTIIDICKKYDSGEILLFSIGRKEITQAVDYLNTYLPQGNICLPFFSELNGKYRTMIEKIENYIGKIRNLRGNISKEWGSEYIEIKDVPENTYKRAIIIATNVAEASITIKTLKFVVDTGYAKVSKFNDNLLSSVINIEPISESSRIQRKGRVGRTSNGIIYHMYPKLGRAINKPKYGITNDDFHLHFLKLLHTRTVETNDDTGFERILLNPFSSPYFVKYFNMFNSINQYPDLFNKFKKSYFYEKNLYEIYKKQYLNENTVITYKYFDHTIFNIFNSMDPFISFLNKYETGYKMEDLFDLYGNLYIIHPFENKIIRNINGNIIKYMNKIKEQEYLISTKNNIKQYFVSTNIIDNIDFTNMKENLTSKIQFLDFSKFITDYDGKKTLYSKKINEITQLFTNINEFESITILIGSGYDIQLEIIEILSLLRTINGNPLNIAINKKLFYNKFKNNSDIIALHNICKQFRNNNFEIYKIYNSWKNKINFVNKYKTIYENNIKLYKKYKKNNSQIFLIKPPEQLEKEWNLLNYLYENGYLNEKGFEIWLHSSTILSDLIFSDLNKNKYIIQQICDTNYINYNYIIIYFENLYNIFIKNIISSERDMDIKYGEESALTWVQKLKPSLNQSIINNNIEKKIINTFLFSSPINIAVNINNQFKTLNNYNNVKISNTLCDNISNYIQYLNIREYNGYQISIINNIDPKLLAMLFPIYFNKRNIKNNYSHQLSINTQSWNIFINKIYNNSNYLYFPLAFSRDELPVITEYINKFSYNPFKI